MLERTPPEWERKPLHAVATIQTGLAKGKKPSGKTITLPYLRVANVQDGFLDLSEIKEIEVERDQVDRYLLREGDVLLTEGGDFDKLGRGHIWQGEIPVCLHQNHVFVVRTDREVLDPYFFAALAASPYGKRYFLSCAKQTTNLASINSSQLREFPVLLPPLAEQRRIVEVLGTWDEAIALTEQLIEAKRRRKRGLMQQLLTGKRRLEGFEHEKWRRVRLGSLISTLEAGVSVNSEDRPGSDGELGILKTSAVTYGVFDATAHKAILREEEAKARVRPQRDRIIISRMNTVELVGASAYVDRDYDDLFLPDRLWQIVPSDRTFSVRWLSYVLSSDLMRARISSIATGTSGSMKNISQEAFLALNVPMPSFAEQRAIAEVLSACDRELDLLGRKLGLLREQKKGLMQKLLSGRARA